MREVRAKAKRPTDFGKCPVCQAPLKSYGAKRSTRKYCKPEHRQLAYRTRLAARRAKAKRRGKLKAR
jgi:hypothetical protein